MAAGIRQLDSKRGFTAHSLRHTHATVMHNQGMPLVHIQHGLGHSDVRTTSAYIHSEPAEHIRLAEAYAAWMP